MDGSITHFKQKYTPTPFSLKFDFTNINKQRD